jgi:hypothetical protein
VPGSAAADNQLTFQLAALTKRYRRFRLIACRRPETVRVDALAVMPLAGRLSAAMNDRLARTLPVVRTCDAPGLGHPRRRQGAPDPGARPQLRPPFEAKESTGNLRAVSRARSRAR